VCIALSRPLTDVRQMKTTVCLTQPLSGRGIVVALLTLKQRIGKKMDFSIIHTGWPKKLHLSMLDVKLI